MIEKIINFIQLNKVVSLVRNENRSIILTDVIEVNKLIDYIKRIEVNNESNKEK